MNRRSANTLTGLAAGLLLLSALDSGAAARDGGGNNHGANDHQQQGNNNAGHNSDDHKRSRVKSGQSSPTGSGNLASALEGKRHAAKPPRMTIRPIIKNNPVATAAPTSSTAGADKADGSGKKTQTTNSSPPETKTGATAAVPPANTIAPIIVPASGSPAGSAPNATAAAAPIARDHRHEAGALPSGEGDISLSQGSKPATPTALNNNAPPAASNPAPASQTASQQPGESTVSPDRHEVLRTVNSKPVASPSTPFHSNLNDDSEPKQGFNVQLAHEHRDGRTPQECGAQPGCDISASLRSVGSAAKTTIFSYTLSSGQLIIGTYNTVKSWF